MAYTKVEIGSFMKKLPLDVSSFATLIKEGYLYIDKTQHIHTLITKSRFYFLSRPRRFGKSLFLSTLREIFLGNKELFEGLWIKEKSDYDWPEYPVIYLDFSFLSSGSFEELKMRLSLLITDIAEKYGIDVQDEPFHERKMKKLVENLSKKNKVVILIDECDYPIINSVRDPKRAEENRDILRDFFSVIKGLDEHIRAIFLTGVTKFSRTSIFSGLNNLRDITTLPIAATLLGYTQEEIVYAFREHIEDLAQRSKKTPSLLLEEIKEWYNGYRFSEEKKFVYNPFSVLNMFENKKFDNYWLESGTPSFLHHLLRKCFSEIPDLNDISLSSSQLGSSEIDDILLIPILYQTGYLTIKEYDSKRNLYKLGVPNREVRESFNKYLLAALSHAKPETVINSIIPRLISSLEQNDISSFMSSLQSLFAHIPFQLHIPQERYYHSLFQLLTSVLSQDAQSEVTTDKGRIDLVIRLNAHIYIFELKLDGDPEKALKQIEEKKYYERYLLEEKKIFLVGVSFNRFNSNLQLEYQLKELRKTSES